MWIAIIISELSKDELEASTTVFENKRCVIEDIINRQLALMKIKIPGVQKITITVTPEKNRDFIAGPLKGFSPVVNITKTYDFKLFNSSSEEQQNEMTLYLVEESLRSAASQFGWDFQFLNEIVSKVKESNFKHSYLEWKLKPSKDKKHIAGIEIEMTSDMAKVAAVFYSRDNSLVKKISLVDVRPNRYFVNPLMGDGKWVSDTEFELIDKKKEMHFKASLIKEKAEVYFTPINRSRDKVIDDLLILVASTSDSQALSILQEKMDGLDG